MNKKYLYPTTALILCMFLWGCNSTGIPESHTVKVDIVPEEAGTVAPAEEEFESGTEITLEALAEEGFSFDRWQGDHTGRKNPDTLVIETDMEITAVFRRQDFTLNIQVEGRGSVNEEIVEQPEKTDYEFGTTVRLEAEAEPGWSFDRWEGDLTGEENPQTISIDNEKNVTAVFEQDIIFFSLTTSVEPQLGGSIDPSGGEFESGREVQLRALAADGYSFIRWEGALSGRKNPQELTMDDDKTVRAIFGAKEVSHGYVKGVTPNRDPVFAERTYPVVFSDWDGPGGNNRWLGINLGATGKPTSFTDDDAFRAGWYFQFNRSQGFHHDGRIPYTPPGFETGPATGPPREKTDWLIENDPCRIALGGAWRIPTDEEWRAAAKAGAKSDLNLHLGGNLSRSSGNLFFSRGRQGAYWSSTEFKKSATNAYFAELSRGGSFKVKDPRNKKDGLTVRCIEEN